MKNLRTSAKLAGAMKVKCAVVFTLVSLAFMSQAFAVLRPLFPAKPTAPFGGEFIVIGNDLAPDSAKTAELPQPPVAALQTRPVSVEKASALVSKSK